jgi:hypothetical protein
MAYVGDEVSLRMPSATSFKSYDSAKEFGTPSRRDLRCSRVCAVPWRLFLPIRSPHINLTLGNMQFSGDLVEIGRELIEL